MRHHDEKQADWNSDGQINIQIEGEEMTLSWSEEDTGDNWYQTITWKYHLHKGMPTLDDCWPE